MKAEKGFLVISERSRNWEIRRSQVDNNAEKIRWAGFLGSMKYFRIAINPFHSFVMRRDAFSPLKNSLIWTFALFAEGRCGPWKVLSIHHRSFRLKTCWCVFQSIWRQKFPRWKAEDNFSTAATLLVILLSPARQGNSSDERNSTPFRRESSYRISTAFPREINRRYVLKESLINKLFSPSLNTKAYTLRPRRLPMKSLIYAPDIWDEIPLGKLH